MFRELFAQLDEERALERAAREEERAFQAHKRSLPSRVRLPAWLLEADASVKKFDSNLGQVTAGLERVQSGLDQLDEKKERGPRPEAVEAPQGVQVMEDVQRRVAQYCDLHTLTTLVCVSPEWRDIPDAEAWRMAARSRWGKMLENGKGPGSWRQALRQGELELKDMVAVLKYLQEAGHPDEVAGGARRRILGALWLLTELSAGKPCEASALALRAAEKSVAVESLVSLLANDTLGTAASAALGNLLVKFDQRAALTAVMPVLRRRLDVPGASGVEAARLWLLHWRPELAPVVGRPCRPERATITRLRKQLEGAWVGEMMFATSGDAEERFRVELVVGDDLPAFFADDDEFFRFVEEAQLERRRMQADARALVGRVSGRGTDKSGRTFHVYGAAWRGEPELLVLRQKYSSRSMAWNLRCPLAPAEELSGVWTPGGKQHPMYLRRCTEADNLDDRFPPAFPAEAEEPEE